MAELNVKTIRVTAKLRNGRENVGDSIINYSNNSVGSKGITISGGTDHILKILAIPKTGVTNVELGTTGITSVTYLAVSGSSVEDTYGNFYVNSGLTSNGGNLYVYGNIFSTGLTNLYTGVTDKLKILAVDTSSGKLLSINSYGSGRTNHISKFSTSGTTLEGIAIEDENGNFFINSGATNGGNLYVDGTIYAKGDVIAFYNVSGTTSGTSGTNGSGTSGTSGTSGSSGVNGTSGTSGVGSSGTSGTSGSSGVAGNNYGSGAIDHILKYSDSSVVSGQTYEDSSGNLYVKGSIYADGDVVAFGTNGTSGVNGTSGTSGTSGVSGNSGSSGTSGTSGTSVAVNGTDNHFLLFSGATQVKTSLTYEDSSGNLYVEGSIYANGDVVAFGTNGTSGVNGTSGSSGTNGTSGINGTSGVNGTSGSSGSSGVNGTSGVNGVNGTSGSSGTNGTSGINGTSGVNGTSGINGANGTSGTSGINGTSGTNGTSGANGTSGSSGTSGTSITVSDYVRNTTDSYTGTSKIYYIVTLSQSEYNAISSKDDGTIYIII